MLAAVPIDRANVRQVVGVTPEVLSLALDDDINLAIWQRRLPAHIEDFSALVLSMNQPLAESITLNVKGGDVEPDLNGLAAGYADLHGYEGFIADLSWLVSAYACRWVPTPSACACVRWTRRCARAFTSIMCRCA